MLNTIKRLIRWPWFSKPVEAKGMETGWETDAFYLRDDPLRDEPVLPEVLRGAIIAKFSYLQWADMTKAEKLAALARRNDTIHAEIMRLRKSKKRFTHLLDEQRAVRNERLRLEGMK